MDPILEIDDLRLAFAAFGGPQRALRGVSLQVAAGEIVGLVGESGSGKSVTAMSVLRLLPRDGHVVEDGRIRFRARDILAMSDAAMREIRGREISMIFQEPMSALNPTRRIGLQLEEVIRRHQPLSPAQARERAIELLNEVHIADARRLLRRYPFELSGGMRQRVMIAMAFSCNPALLIADEPTTALDVTGQKQVLLLLREQARARGTAVLFITHDLAVVSQLCDRVYVMRAGEVVEEGPTGQVLLRPSHPYTRGLLRGLPENGRPRHLLPTLAQPEPTPGRVAPVMPVAETAPAPPATARAPATVSDPARAPIAAGPVLQVKDVHQRFVVDTDWLGRSVGYAHALNGVSFDLRRGETLGIAGESGCGKSTLAQLLLGLLAPQEGSVERCGSRIELVFQDPQSSLDPRLPVWRIVMEPVMVKGAGFAHQPSAALRERAGDLLEKVGLLREHLDRNPHEFSGGQRQRIAIARALASDPEVIVLDEPTSALDISVQAQILNLMLHLQAERGLSYVLISHNVSVLRHMCDRVAVMYLGQIVEQGPAEEVFGQPRHPYTRLLLESVPRLGAVFPPGLPQDAELPGNRRLPAGCFFRDRCPLATTGCERPQELLPAPGSGRLVRCHLVSTGALPGLGGRPAELASCLR